jgi:hypothetical protein
MLKFPPFVEEKFADNGAHSHYELIGNDGEVLWVEPDDEAALSKEVESQATDSQQLKQAIALIRQFARSKPAKSGYCKFQEYLNLIEQQACV